MYTNEQHDVGLDYTNTVMLTCKLLAAAKATVQLTSVLICPGSHKLCLLFFFSSGPRKGGGGHQPPPYPPLDIAQISTVLTAAASVKMKSRVIQYLMYAAVAR